MKQDNVNTQRAKTKRTKSLPLIPTVDKIPVYINKLKTQGIFYSNFNVRLSGLMESLTMK